MNTKILDVLLVGQNPNLMMALPRLFQRSGFCVDVITTSSKLKGRPFLRKLTKVSNIRTLVEECAHAIIKKQKPYELIVICDDKTLYEILSSNLPANIKRTALPICAEKDFKHLCSKIGLSVIFSESSIRTPNFAIAENIDILSNTLTKIEKTVFIKIDRSGGGSGVFEINPNFALEELTKIKLTFPVLVQEKIEGELIDVSGFYQNGKLIYFTYSKFDGVVTNKFGPSWLRTYTQLAKAPPQILQELKSIGEALGANGFINMSCIKSSQDNMHYFFEADMRPTVWITYGQYLGNDPVFAINNYFKNGKTLEKLPLLNSKFPEKALIPYIFRMKRWHILFNKYSVFKYCDDFTKRDIVNYFWQGLIFSIKKNIVTFLKPYISTKIWNVIKRF
jgi:hypothetical protein